MPIFDDVDEDEPPKVIRPMTRYEGAPAQTNRKRIFPFNNIVDNNNKEEIDEKRRDMIDKIEKTNVENQNDILIKLDRVIF